MKENKPKRGPASLTDLGSLTLDNHTRQPIGRRPTILAEILFRQFPSQQELLDYEVRSESRLGTGQRLQFAVSGDGNNASTAAGQLLPGRPFGDLENLATIAGYTELHIALAVPGHSDCRE